MSEVKPALTAEQWKEEVVDSETLPERIGYAQNEMGVSRHGLAALTRALPLVTWHTTV